MTSTKSSCSVCDEELEAHTEAWCNACGLAYHLNQRLDLPGKDCGQVWVNEEFLALEFACDTCLNPVPETGSLDDVLDLGEAAAVAGLTEQALAAAATAGQVPHRLTAGGVYLFKRGDLAPFLRGRQ
ncbi:MAG: hypothetical protein IT303_03685 [Dehalococcoidia bacterium]|nr:hypothetical protein [Dehalococcoidia bacterium]